MNHGKFEIDGEGGCERSRKRKSARGEGLELVKFVRKRMRKRGSVAGGREEVVMADQTCLYNNVPHISRGEWDLEN